MMNFNAGNAQHIGARQQQQDSFGFSDPSDAAFVSHGGFLGIVADGMGGLSQGQEASSIAVRSFLATYMTKTPLESVANALVRSLQEANRAVLQVSQASASGDAGTTLVAAVVVDRELYWISAGDSRIYWLHGHELTQLTADHIFGKKLDRDLAQGRISRSDAQNHPERASLTSYLGKPDLTLIDRNTKAVVLRDKDSVLLCSDGFYRGLSDAEIANGFEGDAQHACDKLVHAVLAKDRKQQDNITVIALTSRKDGLTFPNLASPVAIVLVLLLCCVLALSAAGYWFVRHPSAPKAPAPAVQQPAPPPPVTVSKPNIVGEQDAPTQVSPAVHSPPVAGPGAKLAPPAPSASSGSRNTARTSRSDKMHPRRATGNAGTPGTSSTDRQDKRGQGQSGPSPPSTAPRGDTPGRGDSPSPGTPTPQPPNADRSKIDSRLQTVKAVSAECMRQTVTPNGGLLLHAIRNRSYQPVGWPRS